MPRDTERAALDAIRGMDHAAQLELLSYLAVVHPDCVLQGVHDLRKHRTTIDRLLQRGPALDAL